MGTSVHKKKAPKNVKVGIISVSTTRKLADDKSGGWIKKACKKEGHEVVFHQVIPDEVLAIKETVNRVISEYEAQAVLLTGGTGISPRDVTIEAVAPMFDKELTAFGAIFAQLSYEEIDSAALLSRATAGIAGKTVIFCMPGSLKACKLACKALILPELGHIAGHLVES